MCLKKLEMCSHKAKAQHVKAGKGLQMWEIQKQTTLFSVIYVFSFKYSFST